MPLYSWQQRFIAMKSKSPLRSVFVGILLLMFLLNLASACGLAQTPERRIPRERPRRGIQQEELSAGDMQESITYQGRMRTYILHTPRNYSPSRLMPLVLVFHGGNGKGIGVEKRTRFSDLADREGFFVAYPDGVGGHWNDGRLDSDNPDVDDVGFVRTLIDHLVKTKNIDSSRVYATGISNGGAMTHRLACELSDKIAAFAPVSSSLSVRLASSCKPSRQVSMLMFNSPDDPFLPWEGGEGRGRGGVKLSVPQTLDWWRKQNNCSSQAENKTLPPTTASDGTQVMMSRYSGCRGGSEVILYTIQGGGHSWPGAEDVRNQRRRERVFGRTTRQISATQTIWQFFQRHSLQ